MTNEDKEDLFEDAQQLANYAITLSGVGGNKPNAEIDALAKQWAIEIRDLLLKRVDEEFDKLEEKVRAA